jgi:4-amino-4-deoxy-L-arabinose transferase-like glycosyltransferase
MLSFLPFLGGWRLIDPSDAWYAEGAREMVALGNYLTPHLNYEPWLEKPIMIFWLTCASYKLLGVNEFAARLPSALSAIALIALVFNFARKYIQQRVAIFAAMILLSSPLFCVVGHMSQTDMPLTLFVFAALSFAFDALRSGQTKDNFSWIGFYVACGLAVLTKGPIGFALPSIIVVAYILWTNQTKVDIWNAVKRLNPVIGLGITLLVAAPWFVVENIATQGAFFREFFVRQNLDRVTGHLDHVMPAWFYLPIFLGGFFPWSICLLSNFALVKKLFLRRFSLSPRTQLITFCLMASGIIICTFAGIPSKLPTYILPAWPFLAISAAGVLDLMQKLKVKRPLLVSTIIVQIGALGALGFLLYFANKVSPAFVPIVCGAAVMFLAFLPATIFAKCNLLSRGIASLTIVSVIGCAVLVPFSLKTYSRVYQKGQYRLVDYAKQANLDLAVFGRYSPGYLFYYHKPIPMIHYYEKAVQYVIDHKQCAFIAKADRIPLLTRVGFSVQVLKREGNWCLLMVSNN